MITTKASPTQNLIIIPFCKENFSHETILGMSASEKTTIESVITKELPSDGIIPIFHENKIFILQLYSSSTSQKECQELGKNVWKIAQDYHQNGASVIEGAMSVDTQKNAYLDGIFLGEYCFEKFKTKGEKRIETIEIINQNPENKQEQRFAWAHAIAFAKDISNLPPSIATPEYLEKKIKEVFAPLKNITIRVIDEKKIKELNMNGIWEVGKAAESLPRMLVIEYAGGEKDEKPKIIIGKGITYDTGGLSIKTAGSMRHMKRDMAGAASAIGTVLAVAKGEEKINVIALAPLAENAIGPRAYKPDDIISMANGSTVEVTNTDAEGRLILADALWYAQKHYTPEYIIDLATLTGACAYAVGDEISAGFSNDDILMQKLITAGQKTNEPIWRLPLYAPYKKHILSKIADIVNANSELKAGTIQAALFLEHFIEPETKWAHIDIAFTAFDKKTELATGIHIRTLLEVLREK